MIGHGNATKSTVAGAAAVVALAEASGAVRDESTTVAASPTTQAASGTFSFSRPFEDSGDVAAADGSPTAGSDYVATSGTLTFAPNVASQTVTVSVLDGQVLDEDGDDGSVSGRATGRSWPHSLAGSSAAPASFGPADGPGGR